MTNQSHHSGIIATINMTFMAVTKSTSNYP